MNQHSLTSLDQSSETPTIFIGCLAAYNDGILHGEWIDATQDIDALWQTIQHVLNTSPIPQAEEWILLGYEYFGGYQLSVYESIGFINELAQFIDEHGLVAGHLAANYHSLEEAKEVLKNDYCGEYDNEEYYACELFDEVYNIPDNVKSYIDYEKFARDLFISDYFALEVNGRIHVFHNT